MMTNIAEKIINFLLVVLGIFILSNDIFQTKGFVKTKIFLEHYLVFSNVNINNIFKKILSIKYTVSSYFHDINNVVDLLEENAKLKDKISELNLQKELSDFLKIKLNEKNYEDFEFIPVEIINQNKDYGIIFSPNTKIERNDIIINECRIIAKISYVGNQISIVSLPQNKKFIIPFVIKNTDNTGLYSFTENKIIEIKRQESLSQGDELVTFEKNSRIPNGIEIGKISAIENNKSTVNIEKCENRNFGFIVSRKQKN